MVKKGNFNRAPLGCFFKIYRYRYTDLLLEVKFYFVSEHLPDDSDKLAGTVPKCIVVRPAFSPLGIIINQIKIVLPDDVETLEIEKGKDYVTLITCTPYGVNSHRLLVRGERTVYKQSESKIEDMIKKNNLKYIMLTAGVILALIGMTVLVSVFLIKRRKRRKLNEK